MPFNLLLLPLLGGYIFSTFWNRTKWEVKRYEGQRLILYVSFWGTFFLFLSIMLLNIPVLGNNLILFFIFLFKNFNVNHLSNLTEEQFAVSVLAFLLGATFWFPLNFLFKPEREIARTIKENGNRMEKMIYHALKEQKLILITLKNRKVYIGYVIEDSILDTYIPFLTIWPVKSGYRHLESLQINIDTDYEKVYKSFGSNSTSLDIEEIIEVYDFRKCIRLDEVISLNIYEPDIYAEFQSNVEAKL